MALHRYQVTRTTTVHPTAPQADHTGGRVTDPASPAWSGLGPETFHAGQVVLADPEPGGGPSSALFAAIGSANLRELSGTDRPAASN